MPFLEKQVNNLAANLSNYDELQGERAAQIDPGVRAAIITLYAVSSALGLTHSLFVGSRNPLTVSDIPVSATPNQIITDQNLIVGGMRGRPGEIIRYPVSETAGAATTDLRFRLVVSEL